MPARLIFRVNAHTDARTRYVRSTSVEWLLAISPMPGVAADAETCHDEPAGAQPQRQLNLAGTAPPLAAGPRQASTSRGFVLF